MTTDPFEYDVALSFAVEDRALAEELAALLNGRNIEVFLDEYQASNAQAWGKDIVDHLVNLYSRKARYCVILVSKHYPLTMWTEAERTSARERALRDPEEYILPVQLDDANVPGLADTMGYTDLRQPDASMESIADRLGEKLREQETRPGPPPHSHDLRSGNVPSQQETPKPK